MEGPLEWKRKGRKQALKESTPGARDTGGQKRGGCYRAVPSQGVGVQIEQAMAGADDGKDGGCGSLLRWPGPDLVPSGGRLRQEV